MNKKSSGASPDLPAAAAEGSYRYSTPPPQTGSGRKITRRQFLTRGRLHYSAQGCLPAATPGRESRTGWTSPGWSFPSRSYHPPLQAPGWYTSAMCIWASTRMSMI
ncbi:hypothetical protein [Paenibacillus sonchi]|uniref:hypothetical protein n=1 Tax=Paenibacillus sonchi TaxID=373687 RepID=UPI001F39BB08|nr:hypothetical protein [Paenibacillus sonchi]